jgi:hypothetical protein
MGQSSAASRSTSLETTYAGHCRPGNSLTCGNPFGSPGLPVVPRGVPLGRAGEGHVAFVTLFRPATPITLKSQDDYL